MAAVAEHLDEGMGDEARAVYQRRYKEARKAGLTIVESQMFADSGRDVGELRSLVERRCPPQTIARILL